MFASAQSTPKQVRIIDPGAFHPFPRVNAEAPGPEAVMAIRFRAFFGFWTALENRINCRRRPAGMEPGQFEPGNKWVRADFSIPAKNDIDSDAIFFAASWPGGIPCYGCKISFCTRQFSNSATKTTFSDGQAISWIHPNCPSCLPDSPSTPSTLPSRLSLYSRPG